MQTKCIRFLGYKQFVSFFYFSIFAIRENNEKY